jgi:hypothetical protein
MVMLSLFKDIKCYVFFKPIVKKEAGKEKRKEKKRKEKKSVLG